MRTAVGTAIAFVTVGCAQIPPWQGPPTLPLELSVPPNARLSQVWQAEGIQPYTCLTVSGGAVAWVPGEPSANLRKTFGANAGRQDGWTWTTVDGARYLGRVAATANSDNSPAYLIVTGSPGGSESARRVRYIQRVVTRPADPPRETCDPTHVGNSTFGHFIAIDYVYEEIIGFLPGGCGDFRQACCQGTVIQGNLPVTIYYCHTGLDCDRNSCVPSKTPPPPPCGGLGQSCCKDPDYYDQSYDFCTDFNTTTCFPWLGDHGTCEPCGRIGQAACLGGKTCHEGVARNNSCVACGGVGQPCCSNGCPVSGTCSAEVGFTCVGCGDEGQPVCGNGTCNGDLHPNLGSRRVACTASCGHSHQLACATQYPVAGGVSWRYRCYDRSKLFAGPGPAIPENCMCVPNTTNDQQEDVSDNSGLCVSSDPPAPDRPDPPDCEEKGCSGG
jgi:hypothetical protein